MIQNLAKTTIRRAEGRDRAAVTEILERTRFFRPVEIKVAQEVFDTAVKDGPQGEYQSYVAAEAEMIVGWICFGVTPCTLGTFDIYWIAVDTDRQSRGVGTSLMEYATEIIKSLNGRMIVVDTSGSERYVPTRRFYEKLGYTQAATINDFYAPGDDKVIYVKRL